MTPKLKETFNAGASVTAMVGSTTTSGLTPTCPTHITVKLPKLQIPKYNRELRSWETFWNQFDLTIHRNTSLSNISKFRYLRSYLVGKAQVAIKGLQMTEDNYSITVDVLKQRFGRKDLIIDDHMSRLLRMRPVHDSSNVERLRALFDEL